MFSSRSVQIAAVFSDVFGQALPNLCRSFYNETKAEMFFSVFAVALLAEGVDRNSRSLCTRGFQRASPSSRRAWIEIKKATGRTSGHSTVALLAEGVDRNGLCAALPVHERAVALLAEGVDRNPSRRTAQASSMRQSPSSRRAWIEIASRTSSNLPTFCRPPRGGRG